MIDIGAPYTFRQLFFRKRNKLVRSPRWVCKGGEKGPFKFQPVGQIFINLGIKVNQLQTNPALNIVMFYSQ
jgi:hypothetical protein